MIDINLYRYRIGTFSPRYNFRKLKCLRKYHNDWSKMGTKFVLKLLLVSFMFYSAWTFSGETNVKERPTTSFLGYMPTLLIRVKFRELEHLSFALSIWIEKWQQFRYFGSH